MRLSDQTDAYKNRWITPWRKPGKALEKYRKNYGGGERRTYQVIRFLFHFFTGVFRLFP